MNRSERPAVRSSASVPARVTTSPDVPLGAAILPGNKGTTFRVWAPNADAVSVVGVFNDWRDTAHPLTRDAAGVWSGTVAEAQAGHEYRYAQRRGENKFTRVDPRALKVTNSAGNGIVWSPPVLPPQGGDASEHAPFVAPTLDRL